MHEGHEALPRDVEQAGHAVIDSALAVHRATGPGLLESAYEVCPTHELRRRGHTVLTQLALPVIYDSVTLDAGYRIDLMVDDVVIVEVKAVNAFAPIHEAQLLTYLRLSKGRLGLLINFNVVLLKQGIKRMVL